MREESGVWHELHDPRVAGSRDGAWFDRGAGRNDDTGANTGERVHQALKQLGLALVTGAESDDNQWFRPVVDLQLVRATHERRRVEDRADELDVRRQRNLGFELAR